VYNWVKRQKWGPMDYCLAYRPVYNWAKDRIGGRWIVPRISACVQLG
jgi:hypothetical protein